LWSFPLYFFDKLNFAIIPFLFFTLLNYIATKDNGIFRGLLRSSGNKNRLGVILYPLSLTLILIVSFAVSNSAALGGIGVITMAFGDGFASLIGQKYPLKTFSVGNNTKSIFGSLSMFAVSMIFLSIYITLFKIDVPPFMSITTLCFVLALAATVTEMVTPSDFDNLSVPLVTLGCYLLLLSL
jgi:phytol kinase